MAIRLWFLFPMEHRSKLRNVFAAMSIGQTMNSFFPARAGDFYKLAVLSPKPARADFTILTLTGIMAADKLVDLFCFLILIFSFGSYKESLATFNFSNTEIWKWVLGTFFLSIFLWYFLLKKRWAKLSQWLFQFFNGLRSLLAPKQLFLSLCFGVLVWVAEAVVLQQLSFYQTYPLTLPECFFVLTMLNIAIAIPISVANIGPFEASMAFALSKLGMPLETALAVATVHHGLQMVAYLVCGSIGWGLRRWGASSN